MDRGEICIRRGLVSEGGFVNNPKDPGGPTNRGVTLGLMRQIGMDVDGDGDVDIDDVRKLTEAEAIKVYRIFYWNQVHGDLLKPGVDYCLFDTAINSGVSRSVILLQRCIGSAPDGQFGPKTMSKLQSVNDNKALINKLCDARLTFMKRLRNKKTGELLWKTFGHGWEHRVESVRAAALLDYARVV